MCSFSRILCNVKDLVKNLRLKVTVMKMVDMNVVKNDAINVKEMKRCCNNLPHNPMSSIPIGGIMCINKCKDAAQIYLTVK